MTKKDLAIRSAFAVVALALAITGRVTDATWLYAVAVTVVIVGVAVVAKDRAA